MCLCVYTRQLGTGRPGPLCFCPLGFFSGSSRWRPLLSSHSPLLGALPGFLPEWDGNGHGACAPPGAGGGNQDLVWQPSVPPQPTPQPCSFLLFERPDLNWGSSFLSLSCSWDHRCAPALSPVVEGLLFNICPAVPWAPFQQADPGLPNSTGVARRIRGLENQQLPCCSLGSRAVNEQGELRPAPVPLLYLPSIWLCTDVCVCLCR